MRLINADKLKIDFQKAAKDAFRLQTTVKVGSMINELCDCIDEQPTIKREYEIGKWKQVHGYATPGGTPVFVCANCGGSEHLHGAEYPERKVYCEDCGMVNIYPWEKIYEDESKEM